MRRVGVLMGYSENDPEGRARVAAFRDGLQKLGWTEGRNIRIDPRWAAPGDADSRQRFAQELVALQPDLILSHGTPGTATLLQQTRTIPILFSGVSDPVGSIYPFRSFTADGGLVSYSIDVVDLYRRAAGYVDRILKGSLVADMPVQQPTKYELVINLKTAKTLGLEVPPSLLARADEVIE
jgi:ABC-type uncharacterized transport system substrate-binding protein